MESFYGGKQGISFTIVEHFDSVSDMCTAFSKGGNYSKVNYGEYVIIDTIVNLNKQESVENGLIYCRGYNYTETIKTAPSESSYKNSSTGKVDKTAYKKAMRKYFAAPGAGAMYVGQIVGPQGETPAVEVLPESTVKTYSDAVKGSGSLDIVSGEKQNNVTYAYCNLRDADGNITGCAFGFTVPYHVFNISAESISAYNTSYGTYNSTDKSWSYKNLITKTSGNDNSKPYYSMWDIKIPKGIHGTDIVNFAIDKDTQEYYYVTKDYSQSETGTEERHNLGAYNRTISHITFDEDSSEFVIEYSQGVEDRFVARLIHDITIDPETCKLKITYTDKDEQGNRKSELTESAINWVEKMAVDKDTYHLLVYYSDPELRGTYTYNGETGWQDLGYVRGEAGGVHIIGDLSSVDDLPDGGLTGEYKGWVYTVTTTETDDEGKSYDKSVIYAYDYQNEDKGWYSIGSIDMSLVKPGYVMTVSEADSGSEELVPADGNDLLQANGYWFVVEDF